MKPAPRTQRVSELKRLRSEVAALRSFVIGIAGRDAEGAYRPEFVHRIQQLAQDAPVEHFENADQFLGLLSQSE